MIYQDLTLSGSKKGVLCVSTFFSYNPGHGLKGTASLKVFL